jgi:dihydroorotase
MDIVLQNGRVIDPATGRDEIADVGITAGRIAAIGRAGW